MSVRPSDLVFFAGGECVERYGVLVKRTSPAEDVADAYARASAGLYVPRGGGLLSSEVNAPRVSYLDSAGDYSWTTAALLLEGSRTNVLLRSEELGNAAWSDIGTPVVTSDDAAAPDGATTADKIEDDAAGTAEGRSQAVSVADDSTSWCASIHVRARSGAPVAVLALRLTGGTGKDYAIGLNPATGAASVTGSTDAPPRYGVIRVGASWRLWVAGPNNSTGNTTATIAFYPAGSAALDASLDVATTGYNHAWGAQLENAATPSSYKKTTSIAVARSASIFAPEFTPPPQTTTIYAKFVERGSSAITSAVVAAIGDPDGATYPRLVVYQSGSGYSVLNQTSAGSVSSTLAANPVWGDTVRMRATRYSDGSVRIYQSINGAAETSGTLSAALSSPLATDRLYGARNIYIGARAAGATAGFMELLALKVALNDYTMTEMEAAA